MAVVIRGFITSLRRQPPTDDEIRVSLGYMREMIDGILDDREDAA